MKRRISCFCILLAILPLLTGCRQAQKQSASYYDLFDTFCTFTAYGLDDETFTDVSQRLHQFLLTFHQETDIYQSYDGLVNLKDINDAAGGEPLPVSSQLMDFLVFSQSAYSLSQQRVNPMIGAVTALWHQGRESSSVPDDDSLQSANQHTRLDSLILRQDLLTVQITDSEASLDVGALAKGYAGRLAVTFLQELGVENFILDLGGNICAYGLPLGTGRQQFTIGLQSPNGPEGTYAETLQLQNQCAVTSGDYQRYYEVDGVRYHHIIDPDTLYPSTYHHSVTVIHEDSAMADLLSTAIFLLPEAEGAALAESCGAQVIYLDD